MYENGVFRMWGFLTKTRSLPLFFSFQELSFLSRTYSCTFLPIYLSDLSLLGAEGIKTKLDYKIVVDNFDAEYEYITNEGSLFTFKTNLLAPHYKLINIDFTKPEVHVDLVPESKTDVLNWALCVSKTKLVLNFLQDVKAALFLHDLKTGECQNSFSHIPEI
jgi:hypothetical protein